MFNSTNGTLPVSIPIGVGNGGGFGNGNGFDDIIALAIIAMIFGWNGNGGIFGGGGNGGVQDAYVLNSDFSQLSRQIDNGFSEQRGQGIQLANGISSLGYEQLGQMNGINTNIMQSANAIQTQLADCCCKTQSGIERINTGNAMNTAAIQASIKDCCCENQMIAMQNKFDAAQANCATLQAIDKVGDRIIDYMAQDKAQALRDENQALRLAASQQAQNNYIVNQLRPAPIPSYIVANPYCNCAGNGYGYGFFGGTTIA